MTQYNIAFATDDNYLPFTFVAMQSVIDHISSNYKDCHNDSIVFHVLTDSSTKKDEINSKISSFIERNNSVIKNSIDLHIVDSNQFKSYKGWGLCGSKSIYFRLFIDSILSNSIKTVLYLDVDVLVLSDIRELFDTTNLSERVAAAVLDAIISNSSSSSMEHDIKASHYFNSGMLLINLNEWRRQDIGGKCIEILNNRHLSYPDQDALNIAIPDPIILPSKWNLQTTAFCAYEYSLLHHRLMVIQKGEYLNNSYLETDLLESMLNPSIVHFTAFKPWRSRINSVVNGNRFVCNSDIFLLIEHWQHSAHNVKEFGNIFNNYKFDLWNNANSRLIQLDNDIRHEIKARRKTRKQLIVVVLVVFIVQIAIDFMID